MRRAEVHAVRIQQNTARIDRMSENGPVCRYFMQAILAIITARKSAVIDRFSKIVRVIDRTGIPPFAGIFLGLNRLRAMRSMYCGILRFSSDLCLPATRTRYNVPADVR
jgi:hypothetical protein